MALHRDHRHNPTAPIGLILLKLALSLGAALVKKKLADKLAGKRTAEIESARQSAPSHRA